MREQLIKLSKEKGFESIVKIDSLKADKDNNIGADDLNNYLEVVYYLWMCELQKWLKDKYFILVEIEHHAAYGSYSFRVKTVYSHKLSINKYDTYERVLEQGLIEALKVLNEL